MDKQRIAVRRLELERALRREWEARVAPARGLCQFCRVMSACVRVNRAMRMLLATLPPGERARLRMLMAEQAGSRDIARLLVEETGRW